MIQREVMQYWMYELEQEVCKRQNIFIAHGVYTKVISMKANINGARSKEVLFNTGK